MFLHRKFKQRIFVKCRTRPKEQQKGKKTFHTTAKLHKHMERKTSLSYNWAVKNSSCLNVPQTTALDLCFPGIKADFRRCQALQPLHNNNHLLFLHLSSKNNEPDILVLSFKTLWIRINHFFWVGSALYTGKIYPS